MAADMVIGRGPHDLESLRQELRTGTLNSIRGVLPDRVIIEACRQAGHVYRERVLTPVVTVLHMILAALWPEDSFAASWSIIWNGLVSRLPGVAGQSPSSGSVAKARQRLPLPVWQRIFRWLSQQGQAATSAWDQWRGHRLILLDGTCCSMPDSPANREAFGTNISKGRPTAFPLVTVVTVALAGTRTVLDYAVGAYGISEVVLARPLLKRLRAGDLLIADRLFAAAHFYARYLAQGLEFLTRVHEHRRVDRLTRIIAHGRGDFVTDLVIGSLYRHKDPSLPATVRVRFIRAVLRVRGRREVTWLVTSLLDPVRYPAAEIVALYARRWRIETLFRDLKLVIGADVLRSQTPTGIHAELAARLCALNIVRLIIGEAADRAGLDPGQISFIESCRTILAFAPAMRTAPVLALPALYDAMLTEIAAHRIPQRPGRNEPRLVRRNLRRYKMLTATRAEWRLAQVA
jgi:hypothetical protein